MKLSVNPVKTCPANATDEELLTTLLPYSTVKELVAEYGTVRQVLMNSYPDELERLKGIGPIKARQLQYVCELAKRLYQSTAEFPSCIRSPKDVFDRMPDMQHLMQEEFRVIFLNTKNGIIAERTISKGTLNATVVSPREVFHRAIKLMAASIVLVHNHPSGDPAPSQEDMELTKKMVEAGRVMDIAVIDHVIVGQGKYVSLKEKGAL